jgi:hypothetical protein
MKQIKGIYNINDTDYKQFHELLIKDISFLQNDGQEVEVQYKVNNFDNGQLVYSALILGRVDV